MSVAFNRFRRAGTLIPRATSCPGLKPRPPETDPIGVDPNGQPPRASPRAWIPAPPARAGVCSRAAGNSDPGRPSGAWWPGSADRPCAETAGPRSAATRGHARLRAPAAASFLPLWPSVPRAVGWHAPDGGLYRPSCPKRRLSSAKRALRRIRRRLGRRSPVLPSRSRPAARRVRGALPLSRTPPSLSSCAVPTHPPRRRTWACSCRRAQRADPAPARERRPPRRTCACDRAPGPRISKRFVARRHHGRTGLVSA